MNTMNSQGAQTGRQAKYTRLIQALLALLFLFTPVVFFKYTTKMFYIPKDMFVQILVLTATTVWALKMIGSGEVKISRSPLVIPVTIYLCVMTASIYFSYRTYLALTDWIRFVNYVLVFYLVLHNVRRHNKQQLLIRLVLASGCICAVYGIIQYLGKELIFDVDQSGRTKVFSFFGNPNFLAGFLVTMLPLALGEAAGGMIEGFSGRRPWRSTMRFALGGLAFMLSFLCIIPTQTRGAWLSFGGSSLCFGILFLIAVIPVLRKKLSSAHLVVLFCSALIIILSLTATAGYFYRADLDNLARRFKSIKNLEERNIKQRLLMWHCTWDMIKAHPVIGVGVGNFKYKYFEYQGRFFEREGTERFGETAVSPIRAHNEYLQTAAEMGFLGLLAFLWVLAAGFYTAGKLVWNLKSPLEKVFYASLAATNLGILTHSMVSFPLHRPTISIIFWASFGMCAAAYEEQLMKPLPEPERARADSGGADIIEADIIEADIIDTEAAGAGASGADTDGRAPGTEETMDVLPSAQEPAAKPEPAEVPREFLLGAQGLVLAAALVAMFMLVRLFIANAYIRLGLGYIMTKGYPLEQRHRGAELCYRSSLKIDPSSGEAHFRMGGVLRNQQRYEEAIQEYKKSLEQLQSRFSYFYLGYMHEILEQPEEAKRYFRQLIYYMPNYYDAHYHMASLLTNESKRKEAIHHLLEGIKYDPSGGSDLTHFTLARLYFDIKQYQKTLDTLEAIEPRIRNGTWDESKIPVRMIEQLRMYAEHNIKTLEEHGEEGPVMDVELK